MNADIIFPSMPERGAAVFSKDRELFGTIAGEYDLHRAGLTFAVEPVFEHGQHLADKIIKIPNKSSNLLK